MRQYELNNAYFEWMCEMIEDTRLTSGLSYRKLYHYLHSKEFVYTIECDDNRAKDGVNLRYKYVYRNAYPPDTTDKILSGKPCSIFEMMVALAMRCEESIMQDEDCQIGRWFYEMLKSLGLLRMDDTRFDSKYAKRSIERFLTHTYQKNGAGGLYTIKNCPYDMRQEEIWAQMMWYLESISGR